MQTRRAEHPLPNDAGSIACSGPLVSYLASAASEPAVAANQQLALRLACNCFKHAPLRAVVAAGRAEILDAFAPCCSSTNKVHAACGPHMDPMSAWVIHTCYPHLALHKTQPHHPHWLSILIIQY